MPQEQKPKPIPYWFMRNRDGIVRGRYTVFMRPLSVHDMDRMGLVFDGWDFDIETATLVYYYVQAHAN